MGIAMAGIYTEMVIAACAAIVWLSTYQGPLHQCAMQTILVCTVSTILFNANPLMKYDGYFVLCDWLRMQNLRSMAGRQSIA
jgi:putative peptide zinc metalloprotease protein